MSENHLRHVCGVSAAFLSVRTGTWFIGVVQALFTIIGIAGSTRGAIKTYNYNDLQSDYFYTFVGTAACGAIFLSLIFLLMSGLHKHKACLLFPHLIASIIIVILCILAIVKFLLESGQIVVLNIIYLICFGLFVTYSLWIECRCWKYLREFTSVPHKNPL